MCRQTSLLLQVLLTDGMLKREQRARQSGCIHGQLNASIHVASFRFAPGERVMQICLFSECPMITETQCACRGHQLCHIPVSLVHNTL